MADRTDFYFRQRVTEAELDLAFALLEKADRNLAADLGIYGIVSGAAPTPHTPVPDLTIDLTAPARAYDNLGQRIFFGTGQVVDCSVDHAGIPTQVSVAGEERWLGVFIKFERLLSDPRTDGNSQQVFFRRDESFQIVVRQGPAAPAGAAAKVALQLDELLVCDVRRSNGQTQILAGDIDVSRRQVFLFATGDEVAIVSGAWNVLQPGVNTVQSALDEVDAELDDHFTGAARRHPAGDVDYTPHGFVAAATAAIDEFIDDLSSAAAGTPGASLVGADALAGSPDSLVAETVDAQLESLLSLINARARKSGDTFTGNILASVTGLVLGSAGARWNAFLRDVNATASATGVPAVRAFASDENTPAIVGSGTGSGFLGLSESEAIEASHLSFLGGKIWDLIRGWVFLPQHTGDVPDAVELNGVTQRNIVKAWGSVTAAGALNAPLWNVASISKPGTGRYFITLDVDPGTVNAVVATVNSGALSANYSVHVFSPNGISFEVDINSGGTLTDLALMFVVLGA